MYSFLNDYSEGAHPNILRALETINYHQNKQKRDFSLCAERRFYVRIEP